MVKMNFSNRQTAFDYALYMMAGSFFQRTECMNPLQESKMRIQYKEQKLNDQYKMEDYILDYLESLFKRFPEELSKQEMKVHFKRQPNGVLAIQFSNADYFLDFRGLYHPSEIGICCSLKVRNDQGEMVDYSKTAQGAAKTSTVA